MNERGVEWLHRVSIKVGWIFSCRLDLAERFQSGVTLVFDIPVHLISHMTEWVKWFEYRSMKTPSALMINMIGSGQALLQHNCFKHQKLMSSFRTLGQDCLMMHCKDLKISNISFQIDRSHLQNFSRKGPHRSSCWDAVGCVRRNSNHPAKQRAGKGDSRKLGNGEVVTTGYFSGLIGA